MQRLLLVGMNHTTAKLALREKVVFSEDERGKALAAFKARFPESEAVLISTCNRIELYAARTVHGHPRTEEMVEFLAGCHGVAPAEIEAHVYRKAEREAVKHLFSVASSLDSMVLGETQILGQVREAYEESRRAGLAGAFMNPLFQRATAVGKEVMSQTGLSEGRLSVASVAVDYAKHIFDHFGDKTVLSIGAGKMAMLVLQSFAALRPGKLLVCNRDGSKAIALAERFGGLAAPFAELDNHLAFADIVITSTGATHPIITRKRFEAILGRRRYRPIFVIDIALPRDVEAEVGELENVYLYNIDDLQQVVQATQSQRAGAVEAARDIIERHVAEFAAWQRTREMGPLIDSIYQRFYRIAQEEVDRTAGKLPELNAEQREALDQLARRIFNKLLHDPIATLRSSERMHGLGGQYLHAMEKLFKLEIEGLSEDAGETQPEE